MMTGKHTTDKDEALAYGGQRMSDDLTARLRDMASEIRLRYLEGQIGSSITLDEAADRIDELEAQRWGYNDRTEPRDLPGLQALMDRPSPFVGELSPPDCVYDPNV